jgi:hypothetical protein
VPHTAVLLSGARRSARPSVLPAPFFTLEKLTVILLAILTGIVVVFIWRRHTAITELVILCGWGLLAANTPIGHVPSMWLTSLSAYVAQWF